MCLDVVLERQQSLLRVFQVCYVSVSLCLSVGRSVCLCLCFCLSLCLSVYLPACPPACLSVCLPACPPACLPACLPVCPSVCLSPVVFNKAIAHAIFTVIFFVRCVECRLLLLLDHLFYVDSIIMLCDRCGCMPVDREQNF